MDEIQDLLDRNQAWAEQLEAEEPGIFKRLAKGQSPAFFWIGCADSRVQAAGATGAGPGHVFVHRSVANIVNHTDLNCMSALQFAVLSLKVRHVIVCGHYDCGGVLGALQGNTDGAVSAWLKPVKALAAEHAELLRELDETAAARKLCELNVLRSVRAVCRSDSLAAAWGRGQAVSVHSMILSLDDGRLRSLQEPISAPPQAK